MLASFVSRDVRVAGSTMRYLDSGQGPPVVFLHGNPTSSYLWRDVLPRLAGRGRRLIAVDLIGMGGSGKPAIGYHLSDHIDYVTAFVEALCLTGITFVAHDWGVAISLECLRRQPERVEAVAFMEGHLRPVPSWDDFDLGGREIFERLRTPGLGERLALDENFLIETLLPAGMDRTLTAAEMQIYRAPYADPAARRPLLQWAREIPVAGEPADVAQILTSSWAHLAGSPVRKLLVHGRPGAVVNAATVAWCRQTQPGLAVADVGAAAHFLPEDRPAEVAAALTEWLALK
jgi:haloalkane dehalogenase